jgi:hypothetical protein
MNARNENEARLWDSIDALMNELRGVCLIGAEMVNVGDIEKYIGKELNTIILDAHIQRGKGRLENGNRDN